MNSRKNNLWKFTSVWSIEKSNISHGPFKQPWIRLGALNFS